MIAYLSAPMVWSETDITGKSIVAAISEDPLTGNLIKTVNGVEVARVTASPEKTADITLTTKLTNRLVDLQTIIDRPNVTLDNNDVSSIRQALRDLQSEVKTLARVDRLQTRKLISLLDGTD